MNSLLSTATLYNDWVVLLLIVSFVLVSLTFGADIPQIRKSLRSMFSFKNPDGLLVYAPLSLFGLFLAALHVAVSTGVLIYLYKGCGLSGYSETVIGLAFFDNVSKSFHSFRADIQTFPSIRNFV